MALAGALKPVQVPPIVPTGSVVATQVVPFHTSGAVQLPIVPVPQLLLAVVGTQVVATQDVPFHTIGAVQLPVVPVPQ